MKIDGLAGITMHLLNKNIASARKLADRFKVYVRNIVRDIIVLI